MIIVGGGVIGLSIGWQLLRAGFTVDIYEESTAGQATSRVAAGMLSPYTEAGFEDREMWQLGRKSLSLYPRFLQELKEDSGISVELKQTGSLYAALDSDDRSVIKRIYENKVSEGMPVHWLSGDEARDREPLLSPRVTSAIWIPDECQIDNLALLEALKQAFCRKGGKLLERCTVQELQPEGIRLSNGQAIKGRPIIVCAGPWSQKLARHKLAMRPIKGQILTLKMPPNYRVQRMIRTPRIYLVPKRDGTLRVGATSEDIGMNRDITAGPLWELLEYAKEIVPSIYEMPVDQIEVGFRPLSDNHLPIVEERSGYYFATGHGRSGILLAPWTAYHMKEKIQCQKKLRSTENPISSMNLSC